VFAECSRSVQPGMAPKRPKIRPETGNGPWCGEKQPRTAGSQATNGAVSAWPRGATTKVGSTNPHAAASSRVCAESSSSLRGAFAESSRSLRQAFAECSRSLRGAFPIWCSENATGSGCTCVRDRWSGAGRTLIRDHSANSAAFAGSSSTGVVLRPSR